MRLFFLLSIFCVIIIGIFYPIDKNFTFLIPISLGILILSNIIEIDFKIKDFIRKELVIFCLINYLILPFFVFLITIKLDPFIKTGVLLIAITPTAIGSSVIVKMINGDVKLSIVFTILSNIFAFFSYPLLLKIYLNNTKIIIPVFKILANVIITIFIPFFLSIILKKIKIVKDISKKINKYLNFLVSLIIYISVSQSSKFLKTYKFSIIFYIIIFTTIVAIIYYMSGFLITNNIETKKTFSSSFGQKNTGLCIWIAISNFNSIVALPATIYIVIHHLINALFLLIFQKKEKA